MNAAMLFSTANTMAHLSSAKPWRPRRALDPRRVGLIMSWPPLTYAGIGLYALIVIFQLITLPVELNASSRALSILESGGYMDWEEAGGAKKVLSAAAMTYLMSALVGILSLLRLISLANDRR